MSDQEKETSDVRLYVLRCDLKVFLVKAHSEADALHIYSASHYAESFYPVRIVEEVDGVAINFDL